MLRGGWVDPDPDPDAGAVLLRVYATEWLRDRQLRPKSRQLYEGLLRLTPRLARIWHAGLVRPPQRRRPGGACVP